MKPTGNAHQINLNAVNAMKRKTDPCAPNRSLTRSKRKKAAARQWPSKQDQ
ncbi:MAG: hypothetical protein ABSA05_01455 [Opitutaceae bacterium]|jgi:hypothetical protein